MLTGLKQNQRQKFRRASAVLRLHAYNAKEDESKYYDDLLPCGCSVYYDDLRPCGYSIPTDDEYPRSDIENNGSDGMHRAMGKKDLNTQDGADGQDGKQEENAVHKGVSSARASSPSYQTMRKAKLEMKPLRPRLKMLGCGNYTHF